MEFEELTPSAPNSAAVPAPNAAAPTGTTIINSPQAFESMQFASSSITLPDGCYRVYTSDDDFIEVEASSAYEAMQKTNIRSPIKIKRHSLNQMAVLTPEILNTEAQAATAQAEEVQAAPTQEAAPATAEAPPTPPEEAAASPDATEAIAQEDGLDDSQLDALLNSEEAPQTPPE